MLMTAELTDHARTLLEAVKATSAGKWVKRKAIAGTLGKRTLSAADIALLEVLSVQGFIESREEATNAPSGRLFVYRSK